MTASELEAVLKELGWSEREMSIRLGCSRSLVTQWKNGRAFFPPKVGVWLSNLLQQYRANPPPSDWRIAGIHAEPGFVEPEQARDRDHERSRAYIAVIKALKTGALIKKPCEVCGSEKVEAHHVDYSRPLDVAWLCGRHHHERHKQECSGRHGATYRRRRAEAQALAQAEKR